MTLPVTTNDTRLVLQAVRGLFWGFLRKGYGYKKCGVALLDLSRPENLQHDLFQAPTIGNEALMKILDAINRKFGLNTAGFAASGWKENPNWECGSRMCHRTTLQIWPVYLWLRVRRKDINNHPKC